MPSPLPSSSPRPAALPTAGTSSPLPSSPVTSPSKVGAAGAAEAAEGSSSYDPKAALPPPIRFVSSFPLTIIHFCFSTLIDRTYTYTHIQVRGDRRAEPRGALLQRRGRPEGQPAVGPTGKEQRRKEPVCCVGMWMDGRDYAFIFSLRLAHSHILTIPPKRTTTKTGGPPASTARGQRRAGVLAAPA